MSRALVLLWVVLTGCATGPHQRSVKRGSPTEAALRDVPVKGFETHVSLKPPLRNYEGELLAVDAEHVWILEQDRRVAIHHADVRRIDVILDGPSPWPLLPWTIVGGASTLSHGVALIFSAPVWALAGTVAMSVVGAERVARFTDTTDLFQFARFPAGLPQEWAYCPAQRHAVGPDGALLARLTRLSADSTCGETGVSQALGFDRNADGELQLVDETSERRCLLESARCGAEGSALVIRTAEEWSLLAQSGCQALDGELELEVGLSASDTVQPALARVTGTLRVRDNAKLERLHLGALLQVGRLDVSGNEALQELSLPALTEVTTRLKVHDNPSLTKLVLPQLRTVKDAAELTFNASLSLADVKAVLGQLTTPPAQVTTAGNREP